MESAMLRLNTDAYPPMIHVMPLENVFRDDTVCQAYTREELLAGAPARHDGYWQVPRLVQ
ncbi:MAG: aspartyl/glutamyl-tRNA amidotransferase subunit C [Clostridia bacterium]|nr:aspartyl/glutamyl-tRNA amidotransferase subunit C [Clostridia bacterium]